MDRTSQSLLRTILLQGARMFSLLATMVVTTCVIFVVGVVGGGPFGGGIAMMAAMAAMLGGVVGGPLALAGILLLGFERLRSLPAVAVTALLIGGIASALAWLTMVSPQAPAPVVYPHFLVGVGGVTALATLFRIARLRSTVILGIVLGIATACSAIFVESADSSSMFTSLVGIPAVLLIGAGLGAVWGWAYGFPASWFAHLEDGLASDASMTREEREQFGSRMEQPGGSWMYVILGAVALVGVGLFVFRDRIRVDRPPAKIEQVVALQYDKDALNTSFVLVDSLGRETRAPGRALIDIRQGAASDTSSDVSSGVLNTVYEAVRDVDTRDYRTAELLLGGRRLECDLGRLAYADIDRWHELQGGRAPRLDTEKSGEVGVRFVTSSGDTLERESYPFPGLWPRGSK